MDKKEQFYIMAAKMLLIDTEDMIFAKDNNLRYILASDAFAHMVGYRHGEELCGKTDFEIFNEQLAIKYTEDDRKLLKLGRPIKNYIEPLPDRNGRKKYSSTSKYILYDESGAVLGLYGIAHDVTTEIELEEERENRELSAQLFEAVLEADLTNNIMLQGEGASWVQKLELKKGSSFTDTIKKFAKQFLYPEFVESFVAQYDRKRLLNDFSNGNFSFNHIYVHSLGGENAKYLELKTRLYFSRINNAVKITTFIKDIDDDVKKKEALRVKALTDNLTGLYNREGVEQKISKMLKENDGEYALVFIDLDNFKQLNDTFGHLYGDRVLQEIAVKLKDINDSKNIVGRFGGDEFVVFVQYCGGDEALNVEAEKIVKAAQYYKFENSSGISITCSVGVAKYADGKTLQMLYDEADKSMYYSKKHGKNRYTFYDESMDTERQ